MYHATWCNTAFMVLLAASAACGDSAVTTRGDDDPPVDTADTGSTRPAWNDYLGAHYAYDMPRTGPRTWARGGLRDPGGTGGTYFPELDSEDVITDARWTGFQTQVLPELEALLARDEFAVVQAGGASATFFDTIDTEAGREAFRQALEGRVDAIHALAGAAGWETRVVFQFGNEIQNVDRFYGEVCLWATAGQTRQCDLVTEFVPTYVDRYLAPGVEILQDKSTALFGRPDAIRVALGSVVNLVTRAEMVDALLERVVVESVAPTLVGARVADFIDTVTIHYTMPGSAAPAALDDFRSRWMTEGSVHALWITEEVGVRAAESGAGMAVALRAIAPALRFWTAHDLGPSQAHLFIWGADIACADCTSVDMDMPVFASFLEDQALIETADTTLGPSESSESIEMYSYRVGDAHGSKRVVLAWSTSSIPVTVTSVAMDLSDWAGRQITGQLYRVGEQGLTSIPVVTDTLPIAFDLTLADRDVLLLMLEAQ